MRTPTDTKLRHIMSIENLFLTILGGHRKRQSTFVNEQAIDDHLDELIRILQTMPTADMAVFFKDEFGYDHRNVKVVSFAVTEMEEAVSHLYL